MMNKITYKGLIFAFAIIAICGCSTKQPSDNSPVAKPSLKNTWQMEDLPINSVKPSGWFRKLLETQRDGLTMNFDSIGYPFDTEAWKVKRVSKIWEPYEQNAYWIDGMTRLGYLLNDQKVIDKANSFINYVMANADKDGIMGPAFLKKTYSAELLNSSEDPLAGYYYGHQRWPYAVLFRAFMAEYNVTGDMRLVDAIHKQFLNDKADYSISRGINNLEIMLWIYTITGDIRMKELAIKTYNSKDKDSYDLPYKAEPMTVHGPMYMEHCKLGAIMYLLTGEKSYLELSIKELEKVERDHMLIDGVPSGQEATAGRGFLQAHETCVIVDYTWTCGYLLMATGDPRWADRIERACLNAGMGAIKKDFKALQYFSRPNQIAATINLCPSEGFLKGSYPYKTKMAYIPIADQYCCSGNVNRLFPNYANRMWMKKERNGKQFVYAALYAPGDFETKLKSGNLKISEETEYPFSEKIVFKINESSNEPISIGFRIPAWCNSAEIKLNSAKENIEVKSGAFALLEKVFKKGDVIELLLPMKAELKKYENATGYYVERGPLVYSLKIKERLEKAERLNLDYNDKFPACNLYPASDFAYVLALDAATAKNNLKVVERPIVDNKPWNSENSPVEIKVPAVKIDNLTMDWYNPESKKVEPCGQLSKEKIILMPDLSRFVLAKGQNVSNTEEITMVPLGSTHLRVSLFNLTSGK